MTSSIPDVSKSKNRLKSKPEYNFFKRPDRLSDRSDVMSTRWISEQTSDKNFLEKNQDIKSLCLFDFVINIKLR